MRKGFTAIELAAAITTVVAVTFLMFLLFGLSLKAANFTDCDWLQVPAYAFFGSIACGGLIGVYGLIYAWNTQRPKKK